MLYNKNDIYIIMKISEIKFTHNSERQEFKPIYKKSVFLSKNIKIHSIRIGEMNKKYIFINMKDYNSHQLILNHYEGELTFIFQGVTYSILKDELTKPIFQFKEINE